MADSFKFWHEEMVAQKKKEQERKKVEKNIGKHIQQQVIPHAFM